MAERILKQKHALLLLRAHHLPNQANFTLRPKNAVLMKSVFWEKNVHTGIQKDSCTTGATGSIQELGGSQEMTSSPR